MSLPDLAALTILVVEDEPLVAMMIEDALQDAGCTVSGPVARVGDALTLLAAGGIDAAILDVNLGTGDTYPIAEQLRAEAIPFLFSTGYGQAGLRADFAEVPTLSKPFSEQDLVSRLRMLMAQATAESRLA